MNKNFNFQINSNSNISFGGKDKKRKTKLSAQEEYWLNRILRDHSVQIFVVVVLFLIMTIGSLVVMSMNGGRISEDVNLIIKINR